MAALPLSCNELWQRCQAEIGSAAKKNEVSGFDGDALAPGNVAVGRPPSESQV
jgi:hypothetical protein